MGWVPVESSSLKAVRYIDEAKRMEVQFNNGMIYGYSNVPRAVYDELLTAPSVGRHFHQHIRNSYEFEKMPGGVSHG